MFYKLEKLANAFQNPTNPSIPGCDESSIELMIQTCRKINKRKSYCVVKHWCIWNIKECIGNSLTEPMVIIKSNCIIDDELGRFAPSNWVRTSPITGIHKKCIYETRNTFYICVGFGGEKSIDADDAFRYF